MPCGYCAAAWPSSIQSRFRWPPGTQKSFFGIAVTASVRRFHPSVIDTAHRPDFDGVIHDSVGHDPRSITLAAKLWCMGTPHSIHQCRATEQVLSLLSGAPSAHPMWTMKHVLGAESGSLWSMILVCPHSLAWYVRLAPSSQVDRWRNCPLALAFFGIGHETGKGHWFRLLRRMVQSL